MPNPFESVVYLQIRHRWVGITFLGWSGRLSEWSGPAEAIIAIDRRGRAKGYALDDPEALHTRACRQFSAFAHPRVLIDCFADTQLTLASLLKRAQIKHGPAKPTFVVQVHEHLAGGLTELEHRALIELCRSLGAGKVLLVESHRELSSPEVLQIARRNARTAATAIVRLDSI